MLIGNRLRDWKAVYEACCKALLRQQSSSGETSSEMLSIVQLKFDGKLASVLETVARQHRKA